MSAAAHCVNNMPLWLFVFEHAPHVQLMDLALLHNHFIPPISVFGSFLHGPSSIRRSCSGLSAFAESLLVDIGCPHTVLRERGGSEGLWSLKRDGGAPGWQQPTEEVCGKAVERKAEVALLQEHGEWRGAVKATGQLGRRRAPCTFQISYLILFFISLLFSSYLTSFSSFPTA